MVDLVYEQAAPPFARIGGERAGAGLAADLVAKYLGPVVFPAQGVGADEPFTVVMGDADGSALAQGLFEGSPGGGQGADGGDPLYKGLVFQVRAEG